MKFRESIIKLSQSNTVKIVQNAVLIGFAVIAALDLFFAKDDPGLTDYPTISQIIKDHFPNLIFTVWLYGLFITNVFFQKKAAPNFNKTKSFMLLSAITFFYVVIGFLLPTADNYKADNFKNEYGKDSIVMITALRCYIGKKAESHSYVSCSKITPSSTNVGFSIDFSNGVKLIILLTGIFFGYLYWPQTRGEK